MALSANETTYKPRDPQTAEFEVVNASEIYGNAYVAIGGQNHGTAATRGRLAGANDADNLIYLGFATERATGNTSATPVVDAGVDMGGRIIRDLAVSNLSGDNTDVGQKVYLTDDNTFDITEPNIAHPIGVVVRDVSATNADVYFFSFGELQCISMAGAGAYTWHLGTVVAELQASGNMLTGITCRHHGRITSVYAICASAPTDADLDIDINLEIEGTNVTGGVVALEAADTISTKKSGTAVTAANVFHDGDLIDVEGVVNASGTAGDGIYNVYAEVICDLGT